MRAPFGALPRLLTRDEQAVVEEAHARLETVYRRLGFNVDLTLVPVKAPPELCACCDYPGCTHTDRDRRDCETCVRLGNERITAP